MTTTSTLEPILQSVTATAALPREKSQSLPADAFTSTEFLDFEKREIFSKEWVSLCHTSQIPNPGDFLRIDYLDEPLIVIRGKDQEIRVLSRTCRHRGMDLMPSGFGHPDEGNQRVILCPYHLWSYDLQGKLVGAAEMQEADGFDRSEVCLHEFRSEIWEGFVFFCLSEDTPPLDEKFSRLRGEFVGRWDLANAEMVWQQHWDCPFNWKILLENFMEAYHHMGAHQKTLEPFLPAKGCWTEPFDPNFSAMHLPLKDSMQQEILDSGNPGTTFPIFPSLELEDCLKWWVFLGLPNFLLFNAPDRVYWYRLLPTGPQSCSLLTTMLVPREAREVDGYETLLEKEIKAAIDFHMEDMEVCTATQRGMNSVGYAPGRLSHLEEPIWQFQRYLASRIQALQ